MSAGPRRGVIGHATCLTCPLRRIEAALVYLDGDVSAEVRLQIGDRGKVRRPHDLVPVLPVVGWRAPLVAPPSGAGRGSMKLGGVDVSGLVLRDGDAVRASGRVVAVDGATWFDPPLPVPAVAYTPGRQPPPRPSGLGVPAIGVDLARLDKRWEKQGAVEGCGQGLGNIGRDVAVGASVDSRPGTTDSVRLRGDGLASTAVP